MANTGLTYQHALNSGINAGLAHYEGTYRPSFMPTNEQILVDLVYAKDSHDILGGQFYSKYDLTQSANTISLAIANHNS